MTQSYRDTGHSCNSRSRVVHVSTRSCLSGTSASWVFRSTGERANSCQCRGSLFSAWSWIRSTRQHASPSTCGVGAELPQDFIRQDGGPTETLSEAPGAYGCSCGEVPPSLLHMRPLQHWLHGRVPRWAWKRGTHRVQITPACRKTFSPWTDPLFLRAEVPLEQVSRHAVVFTDASATGWGATYNRHAVSGVWTGPQLRWHINCLELLAVRLALSRLRGRLRGKDVLVRTDNTATVAYINRQGGLRSRRMSQLARHLLLWSQKHLRSLRAIHIPGVFNQAADELSRAALPGEWRLHPQAVQLIGVGSELLR